MRMSPAPLAHQPVQGGMNGSFAEFAAVLKEQREEAKAERAAMESKLERQAQQAKADRAEMEAKIERQRQEMERKLREAQPKTAVEALPDEALQRLQARLLALHDAQLITEEELYVLEDTIADCAEVMSTMPASHVAVERVLRMVALGETMKADESFARQLRRKHVR